MSRIIFAEDGWADYLFWQSQDKKTLVKISKLLQSIDRDGVTQGEGKPEKLKYRNGAYSRRIDDKGNRLVYMVDRDGITILSCRGHYEEEK